jgi:hypothetical protein
VFTILNLFSCIIVNNIASIINEIPPEIILLTPNSLYS